ncbi:LOW QUALITY PROTEIN: monocarboxylate transporter 12-like [Amphiura filiformis]|uniref:LOW QUALITY PROTEIN: monocarboxylate transporter 12-like n=1 Tax=Amphiura filiformis TaxID=82378 RepID=UPI003B227DB9
MLKFIGIILAIFLVNFWELGTLKCFGVFFQPLQEGLQTSSTALGIWIATCRAFTNVISPLSDYATCTFGERHVLVFGGILCACSLSFAALVNTITWFGVLIIFTGCSFNMVFIASLATTKNYFPNTNHIWGLTSAGGALGMMVLPPICEFLIQIYGWRGALMLLSALNSHLVVCGLLVNQRRDIAAQPYSAIPVTDESAAQQSRCPNIRNVSANISRYISFYLIKNPKFIPIIAAHMLTGVVFTGWTIFLVPHAIGKGLPPQTASFLSFCGGLGALFGRPLMGPIIKNCNIT